MANVHRYDLKANVHALSPRLIYVLMHDRATFDAIALPATAHDPIANGKRCLSKCVNDLRTGSASVIFQYWECPAAAGGGVAP